MAGLFNIRSDVDGFIVSELEARKNPVATSAMKPWIRATSNLGAGKNLYPTKYQTLFGGAQAMYNTADQNRPNPIITGWSVDFSGRGTLRKGTLTIKCFTPRQFEEIIKYYMTPALSVIVEWGWNRSAGGKSVNGIALTPTNVATYYDDDETLHSARAGRSGCYDNMLGVISKGSSDANGTELTVTCTIVSIGEILMGNSRRGQEIPKETTGDDVDKYDLDDFIVDTANEIRPWAYFFNSLKPQFQTKALKKWAEAGGDAKFGKIDPLRDFINYDDLWVQDIKDETIKTSLLGIFDTTDEFEFLGKKWTPYSEQSPILDKKYIKFSALIAIFNKISEINGAVESSNMSPFIKIGAGNGQGTYCAAYRNIFSPDTRIFIPNKNSINFYLQNPFYKASPGSDAPTEIPNIVKGGASFPYEGGSVTYPNGLTAVVDPYSVGWIGDIYVSSDLADQLLTDSEGDVKDVLDNLLSEMSDASQGLWSFQVLPATVGGKITLMIVDSRMNDQKKTSPATFYLSGTNSVFLEASYNIDLPKAMMNKLAVGRSSKTLSDVDGISDIGKDDVDFVMAKVFALKQAQLAAAGGTVPPETPGDDEHKQLLWEAFCRNAGILIDPTISELGGGWLARFGVQATAYLMPGVSTNIDLFNQFRITPAGSPKPGITTLPVKVNFTVLGISGFKFGNVIKIIGLPPPYDGTRGDFLVTEVKHKVDDKLWTTEVEAQFRPNGK